MPLSAAVFAPAAPELVVSQWFNTGDTPTLAALRGRVVLLHAFQMLCPGCVINAVPQARRVHELYGERGVAVIGLHTVFEHHAVMTPVALQAFLHEYRITFPVGVDMPSDAGPIPRTMAAFAMRGTPTLLLIDRAGRLRQHHFGQLDDMALGAQVAMLLGEAVAEVVPADAGSGAACAIDGSCST